MLTKEEEKFMKYWSSNRDRQKKTFRQLIIGLPLGLIFGVAIIAIFSSGWYERANMVAYSSSSPYIFLVAIMLIIGFISIFSRKHKWDMNEQRYTELLHKQNKSAGEQQKNQ